MVAPKNNGRLQVVVGILRDQQNRVLIQQRRPGTPRAGQWEFPGGKVEPDETPQQALYRELKEELGIRIGRIHPLTVVTHDYEHARVLLDIYQVGEYQGQPAGCEGQEIVWTDLEKVTSYDVLEAVYPILQVLTADTDSCTQ